LMGLAAAHGQITERNYSVTQKGMRTGRLSYLYPDTGAFSE